MARPKSEHDPAVVFLVAKLFFEGVSVRTIAERVNTELPERPLNRESVYPLLAVAREMQFVRLVAPLEENLAKEIAHKFDCRPQHITVVRTQGPQFNEYVAEKAARITLDLIRATGASSGKPVGLGLGPGRATLDFSRYLGRLLESEMNVPQKINLFAIGDGSPAHHPEYSSISFFNLFPPNMVHQRVGLFAETVIPSNELRASSNGPASRRHSSRATT